MNKNERAWLLAIVIVIAIFVALSATSVIWFPSFPGEPWEPREHHLPPPENVAQDYEFFYTVEAVVSTVNVTLSIFLLAIYINIYRRTRSEFTVGLTIFSAVFLLNALALDPFVQWAFGFHAFGLGPFAMLPDVFTLGALAVLLYLSFEY